VDALIVREPRTAVELFDLGVFENRDMVLVSSGHGGSLFLRGHGTPPACTACRVLVRLQSRKRALADDIVLEPGLLQFSEKTLMCGARG
jgi:hypothetical protein